MSFWDKWKFPIMAAAATIAAPYAAPALGGLLGVGGGAAGSGAGVGAGAGLAPELFGSMEAGNALGGFGVGEDLAMHGTLYHPWLSAGEMASGVPGSMLSPHAQMLPEGASPAMSYPTEGPDAMPGDMLWPEASASLESGRQGALDPNLLQVAKRGLASAKGLLGDEKMGAAAYLMRRGGSQPVPMMAASRPQPMPYEPVSRSLTPAEQRRYRALGSFIA